MNAFYFGEKRMERLKGEIKFKDGLIVHFEGYRGQLADTIKYFDENNEEVPYNQIVGRRYDYYKLTGVDGSRFAYDNFVCPHYER